MPPGLGRVAIASLGAAAVAAGAVLAFRDAVAGVLFVLGGAALLAWSVRSL
jgi:hypothetical protein